MLSFYEVRTATKVGTTTTIQAQKGRQLLNQRKQSSDYSAFLAEMFETPTMVWYHKRYVKDFPHQIFS